MSLSVGARIGPYDVLASLGAGGMGEVYRARDTRLNRDVALKVLPEAFAADPERLARFRREAQVLAALNHPHIAAIYGLEEADHRSALVLELVDGPTLADRIAQGPISVHEALPIARQIAEALEAAHEQGIVHRDLKPANIKVTTDGVVKVLDFGLAKLAPASGPGSQAPAGVDPLVALTQSPTLASPAMMTGVGVILGTAPYMAPEQAKGRPADKRSDVWAFGCVLYEMLTAKRAFDGADVSETLAAILMREPDWNALPSTVPPPVVRLVRRCLERDRTKRIGDVAAVLFALEEVGAAPTAQIPRAGRRGLRGTLSAAAALVVTAVAAGTGVWWMMRPAPSRVMRTMIATAEGEVGLMGGWGRSIAFTPDGSRVAYLGNNGAQLMIRPLDQLSPTMLVGAGTGALRDLFVSPDGQWIGFADANVTLNRIPIAGGPSTKVAALDGLPRGASWGPDGTIIVATQRTATGLQRVPANGGELTALTRPDTARGEIDHYWPEFLPGSTAVLFTIWHGAIETSEIAVLDLDTGAVKVVLRGGSDARYIPTGHLLYASAGGTLRAVRFDLARLEAGEATAASVIVDRGGAEGSFTAASDGALAYIPGGSAASRMLVWVDLDGRETPVGAPPRPYIIPRVSPDGMRLAVTIDDEPNDLWIYELTRRTLQRLTFDPGPDRDQVWTQDGREIAYFSMGRSGGPGIFIRSADGTGEPRRLTSGDHRPGSWSRDGRRLVFADIGGRAVDVGVVSVDANARYEPLIASEARETGAYVSPDGRWIAYFTNETGTNELFVRPFPDVTAGRWRISTDGADGGAVWAPDSTWLYYAVGATMKRVPVGGGPPSTWGQAQELFSGPYLFTSGPRNFDIAPDGRRFLLIRQAGSDEASTPRGIVVVHNWLQELGRLAP